MNENKTYKTAVLDALDKAVQEVFGNNLEHFFSLSHKREICDVRMMTLKIFRDETDYPYQAIGRTFGKHHATVIHNVRWAEEVLKIVPEHFLYRLVKSIQNCGLVCLAFVHQKGKSI